MKWVPGRDVNPAARLANSVIRRGYHPFSGKLSPVTTYSDDQARIEPAAEPRAGRSTLPPCRRPPSRARSRRARRPRADALRGLGAARPLYRLLTMPRPPAVKSPGTMMPARDRPTSPHLQIYRWQIGNTLSILHRLDRHCAALGLLALCYWLIVAGGRRASVCRRPRGCSQVRSGRACSSAGPLHFSTIC